MGLFKKRKVEEINLEIKDFKHKEVENQSNLYSENKDIKVDRFSILSLDAKREMINNKFLLLQKSNYDLLNRYYLCKVFSRIAIKDKDFNLEMIRIDKNINRVRKELEKLQKQANEIKYTDTTIDDLVGEINEKQRDLENFQKSIIDSVDNVRRKYYNYLKIATVNVCLNKSNFELECLLGDLNNFLDEYKNLNIAAEYIYYNSGVLIVKLINTLVDVINKQANIDYIKTYDFHYFLKSEVVITLEITEWIDLYNKVRFVVKLNDLEVSKYQEVLDLYKQFEVRYLILMMYIETNKKGNFKM